ncbi:TIR domain-containing protein [Rhodopirellula bahusiensis]|uniref:Thoeris protein ThsB TIR-like domain-containing protein n=1 Tax=Rhodopirellula bahusiensis TaxID=2014065 RepID=A0A2G1VXC1_9BACT|nr:hypothetical protein [Rhodopirellula bahusiensis]PHQ31381.1 hypothetical protein CEE69_31415 [Rhodopirellula bahusiensis]
MAKKKVFVSYDFDNDKALKEFLIGQSKLPDSPFEIVDFSLKEAAPEKTWLEKARVAIGRADVFVVLLGPKTNAAPGVLKEVAVATGFEKPRFQLIGYKNGQSSWAVVGGGRTYKWTWDNLKALLS